MKFEVRALKSGAVVSLELDTPTIEDARRLATEQELEVLSVTRRHTPWARRRKFDLSLFSEELAELLDASSDIHQELLRAMREGHAFSVALEKMPDAFPALYVGLIRAAEKTSDLKGALQRYLEYSGRLDGLRNKIVSALIYPAILLTVGGGVVVFLLTFVVPRFSSVYRGTGKQLPLMSQLLLDWGAFASAHARELGLAALVLLAAGAALLFRAHRQGTLERLIGLLPGVRQRVHLFRLSRLYLTVGTLLNGGMPFVQALTLAQGVVGGSHRTQLLATIASLRQGASISASLEQHQLTTAVSSHLLRAGEGTGRMGDLFIRAGRYHDHELGRWVERFSKSFEPILMAVIGIVIGGIVILLYMPIFDLAGSFR
jgi:general secretion pathway protein F